MANQDITPFPNFGAGFSNTTVTSNRSSTPPLTTEQQLSVLQREMVAIKRQFEVSMQQVDFSWENIPNFNPGKKDIQLNKWIRLIEERAYFSRWDDVTTTRYVVTKLEGRAREWYLGGEFAHKNWDQLKSALRRTFDLDSSTTGLLLKDASLYSSIPDQKLVQYFEEKLHRLQRLNWDIPEHEKVNIIVHGITQKDIKQMALANNYQKTEELLTFLRGCDLTVSNTHTSRRVENKYEQSSFKIKCFFL